MAPSTEDAIKAFDAVKAILSPRRKSGVGHDPFQGDELLRKRLGMVKMMLWLFVSKPKHAPRKSGWIAALLKTAHAHQMSVHTAKKIRLWCRAFLRDRELPLNLYGIWNVSMLRKGELAQELHMHLQTLGKWVRAQDIVDYLRRQDVTTRHSLKRVISLRTAQLWMHAMDYRWTKSPSGQYVDGHEREDVVTYRQTVFLPTIAELEWSMAVWKDGVEDMLADRIRPERQRTTLWFQDESTFYAHDKRDSRWCHKDEKAVPRPKGEGESLMVSDIVSAQHGFLTSPDGLDAVRILFKAGVNRQGWFTNKEILKQSHHAMDLLDKHYPNERHVLVFDNATTHLKRPDDALSARKMSKAPTKPGNPFFGVETVLIGAEGVAVHDISGKKVKIKIPMCGAKFSDGRAQDLYFPADHKTYPGAFKGTGQILKERGYAGIDRLRAQCPDFKCEKGAMRCCCRRWLFNEPDFKNVESLLETAGRTRGYQIVFLPKFHCELNFIEQCWGYAKRKYRELPMHNRTANMEANVTWALNSVPIESMRK